MLFKSSFPARFGGRLSSVIDVRTNDGDMQKYHGMLSIGLLTSKFNLEGPIVKGEHPLISLPDAPILIYLPSHSCPMTKNTAIIFMT